MEEVVALAGFAVGELVVGAANRKVVFDFGIQVVVAVGSCGFGRSVSDVGHAVDLDPSSSHLQALAR